MYNISRTCSFCCLAYSSTPRVEILESSVIRCLYTSSTHKFSCTHTQSALTSTTSLCLRDCICTFLYPENFPTSASMVNRCCSGCFLSCLLSEDSHLCFLRADELEGSSLLGTVWSLAPPSGISCPMPPEPVLLGPSALRRNFGGALLLTALPVRVF